MGKFKVSISNEAKADLLSIFRYISHDLGAPLTAQKLFTQLTNAMLTLDILPERCPIIEKFSGEDYIFRQLIVKKYRIIYRIAEDEVIIVSVIYGARHLNE